MAKSNSILVNTISKGALNIFNIIVPILIYPYIYRILSSNTVGKIDYASTIFTYFSLVGLLGIYNYGLREIARKRDSLLEVNKIFKNLFVLGLISNAIVFVIYAIFVYYAISDPILKKIMYVQGLGIIGQMIYIEWVNEANEDYTFITIKTMLIRIVSICCIFLFVKQDSDFYIYVSITTATLIINNIISFVHIRKYVNLSICQLFNGIEIKPLIIPLTTILILNNTNLLYTVADKTILGIYKPAEEVAYYGIGQKVSEMVRILFLSLVYVMIPRLSYYLDNNFNAYKKGIKKIMKINIIIIAPVAFGLLALSKDIVLLFAGKQYVEAIPSMQVFSLRVLILSTEAIVYNQIIFLFRKEGFLMKANAICGVLNVILDLSIINFLDSTSAIFTTILCEITFQCLCYIYISKNIKIEMGLFNLSNLKYILLAMLFIPLVTGIKYINLSSIISTTTCIAACFILYIGVLLLIKDQTTINIVHTILNKFKHHES